MRLYKSDIFLAPLVYRARGFDLPSAPVRVSNSNPKQHKLFEMSGIWRRCPSNEAKALGRDDQFHGLGSASDVC